LIFLEYTPLFRYNPEPLAHAIIPRQVNYQETNGEGITHITVVGDIVSVMLADSVSCAYFVADCMAFVDSVSYCWYCRGGVYCAD
jgi:hypothetical protein